MNRCLATGLVLLLIASLADAQPVTERSAAAVRQSLQPQTLKLLNGRVPEVAFQEAPFDQVMDWIAEYTGFNVVVRWETLENIGIERDKPISMNVRNLRLSQVLWMIMSEAGGSDVRMAYRASGNLLIMSTADDLGAEMIVKVYDVRDLLVKIPDFTGGPTLDIQQQGQQGGQGGGGNQNIFGNAGGGGGGQQQQELGGNEDSEATMGELLDLIRSTVEPDSWVENGGNGTIQAFQQQLIVRNNILVHQRLGGWIAEDD